MFRFLRRSADAPKTVTRSLANEFARLTTAGASDSEALRILFDMVTTNGPVPEIDSEHGRAS